MKLLKVVIPTYNRSNFLNNILDVFSSAKELKKDELDVIVVDDCSNTNHKKILNLLVEKYVDINFVMLDKNTGGAGARNIGAQEGDNAKWTWFFDDDDVILRDSLLLILDFLKTESIEQDLVLMKSRINVNGKIDKVVIPQVNNLSNRFGESGSEVNTSCAIINTNLLRKIGYWDSSLIAGQDTDLFLRLSQFTDAVLLDGVSIDVMQGHESITKNAKKQWIAKVQFLRKNYKLLSMKRRLRYAFTIFTLYPFLRNIVK